MKTIYTDNSKLIEVLVANGINVTCNSQMEMAVSDEDAIKIDAEDKTAKVNTLLACVPLSQRDIVARAFGIGYDRAYEDAEIADALGYTAERIRQIKNAAIARMKTAARNKRIAM